MRQVLWWPIVFVLFAVLWAGGLALFIWALVDCVRVPDDRYFRSGTKLIWVLLIALTQLLGAIIYLAIGRPSPEVRKSWSQSAGVTDDRPVSLPPPPPPPW